ncbi:response regulator transcription factor [Paraburkholderia sp. RL17-373-BIF-A]|uniref:response regulator transcription factor n=1 Tax=Paraburkholderia sp. RL17-373-BIF-A TaxID=3031629 RepID=UPI0038BA1EA5
MATLNKIVAVIDDDESIARAIKRLLRSVAIKAESFSSGEEFLGTLSLTSGWPACVILDYELPGIDGLELQRRFAPTGMPIIFVTAHDDPAVREKALASGAAGYLEKPFDGTILINTIELALGVT